MKFNSLGFRGPDIADKKPENTIRLAFLGDSKILNSEFSDITTFEHWPIRSAKWMGEFDQETASYKAINHGNIQHALDVVQIIVDTYSGHPAVLGIEPVNEPWQFTPIKELKDYYWEGYLIVKRSAPYWKYIMHDSFRFDPAVWGKSFCFLVCCLPPVEYLS